MMENSYSFSYNLFSEIRSFSLKWKGLGNPTQEVAKPSCRGRTDRCRCSLVRAWESRCLGWVEVKVLLAWYIILAWLGWSSCCLLKARHSEVPGKSSPWKWRGVSSLGGMRLLCLPPNTSVLLSPLGSHRLSYPTVSRRNSSSASSEVSIANSSAMSKWFLNSEMAEFSMYEVRSC